jgi:hypothetical protein
MSRLECPVVDGEPLFTYRVDKVRRSRSIVCDRNRPDGSNREHDPSGSLPLLAAGMVAVEQPETLAGRAYRSVQQAIASGELSPNEKITERGLVARFAARHATPVQLDDLDAILDAADDLLIVLRQRHADDRPVDKHLNALFDAMQRFNDAVEACAGNAVLVRLLDQTRVFTRAQRRARLLRHTAVDDQFGLERYGSHRASSAPCAPATRPPRRNSSWPTPAAAWRICAATRPGRTSRPPATDDAEQPGRNDCASL